MSDYVDSSQSSNPKGKEMYPEFVKQMEGKGLSPKTIDKLINEEEITSETALQHLGADTINAMEIPATQKNILRNLVEDLKPSNVAARGGIEARDCSLTVGQCDGEASLASISGAGEGAGIQVSGVKTRVGHVGKEGKLSTYKLTKGDEK